MSLQVWLPLNGDLKNYGLCNLEYTINTNPTFIANGKIGQAMSMGQITMSANNMKSIFSKNTFSICFWIYINADTGDTAKRAMLFGNNSPRRYSLFQYSTCNDLHWSWANDTTNNISGVYSGAFPSYKWTHCAVTYDSTQLKIYLNGSLAHTVNVIYAPVSLDYSTVLFSNCANSARYLNDYRIYDHALSAKEVKEIAKGLVLHYKLDNNGFGNENLLSRYVVPGQAAPTSTAAGGRTTWLGDYKISITAAENADTYFRLFTTKQLTANATYTISCQVSGLLNGSYYNFPLYAQGNTSMGLLQLNHNGLCSLTFTMTYGTQTAATGANGETVYICFMDDAGRSLASGQGPITVSNFKLEEGSIATPWCPNYSDLHIPLNIIYDDSGYQNNGFLNDVSAKYSNDTPRYGACIQNNQTESSATYLIKGFCNLPESNFLTFSWWMKPTRWGKQNSGLFSTSSNNLPTDYNSTAANMRDSCFDCTNVSGTCVRLNVASSITLNEWHHYSLVYNGSQLLFFKDGVQVTSANQTGNLKSFISIFLFYSKAGGVNRTVSGSISDFRIYVTALSAEDIKELYNTSASIDNKGNVYAREVIEI